MASGVPFGGIGAGSFQLMTDGAVSAATFNNNWNQPTGDLPGCFAAVWLHVGDTAVARVLALKSAYGLPTVAALDYDGRFPEARLAFPDPALSVPIHLRVFSPLIPHDVKNSSFPAAAFVFEIRNTLKVPIELSCALSWENLLGVGGTAARGPFHHRDGDSITRVPAAEGYFGLRFAGPATSGGATTEDRLQQNAQGEYALLAHPEQPEADVSAAGWNALSTGSGWWSEFARDGSVSGDVGVGDETHVHPCGVVAVRIALKPGEYASVPFAVAWYTPHHYTLAGLDYKHYYAELWENGNAAARELLSNWRALLALTEEWQNSLLGSNAPWWLNRRLLSSASPLFTNSIHTADGRFEMLDNSGADPGASAVQAGNTDALQPLRRRLASSGLLLSLFPELDANELTQYARAQSASGALPARLGDIDRAFGSEEPSRSKPAQPVKPPLSTLPIGLLAATADPDDASAFVLQMAQFAFATGDRSFLENEYPKIRLALRAILQGGLDSDGLPLPQQSGDRSDSPAPATGSPRTRSALTPASATLWLAALRAGRRVAQLIEDHVFEKECGDAFERGSGALERRLWRDRFYAEPATGACAESQLAGQWIADALGLGDLLPRDRIESALDTVRTRNDATAPASFGPPIIVGDSSPSNGAADICEPAAAVMDDVALGFTRNRADGSLGLLQRLAATRWEVQRSPWVASANYATKTGNNETPGVVSAASMADWCVNAALNGFVWDAFAQELTLDPDLPGTWRSLTAPVFAPGFWGMLQYRPTARGGLLTFRLDRLIALTMATPTLSTAATAALELKSIRIPGPPLGAAAAIPEAHVSLSRVPVGSHAALDLTGALRIVFDAPLTLNAGDRLEVDLH
jgi:uncharacterized protein (DUF608 family)